MSRADGKLVVVGTPIGNLEDMTPRARKALEGAEVVCAEDTRVTGKLLAALGIAKPLERLDENVMAVRIPALIERIGAGETVAFCSDAGMPAISDPGARLVATVREAGLPVEVTPGPSAADTAFVASGCLQTDFYFGGFLPKKTQALRERLGSLRALDAALIVFESPRRIAATVDAIAEVFPDRTVWICRELTKVHEEILSGTPRELSSVIALREREGRPLKGEMTLVIDGPSDAERQARHDALRVRAETLAQTLLEEGVSARTVRALLGDWLGTARNEAYDLVQHLRLN